MTPELARLVEAAKDMADQIPDPPLHWWEENFLNALAAVAQEDRASTLFADAGPGRSASERAVTPVNTLPEVGDRADLLRLANAVLAGLKYAGKNWAQERKELKAAVAQEPRHEPLSCKIQGCLECWAGAQEGADKQGLADCQESLRGARAAIRLAEKQLSEHEESDMTDYGKALLATWRRSPAVQAALEKKR